VAEETQVVMVVLVVVVSILIQQQDLELQVKVLMVARPKLLLHITQVLVVVPVQQEF
jgi:hypothetical protein